MKNFIQFLIPILIICGIGLAMMYFSVSSDADQRLYIKCNGKFAKSFSVFSGEDIEYQIKDEECKLIIEVENVDSEYIKFNIQKPLLSETATGRIDDEEKLVIIVGSDEEAIMHSLDKKTKFEFQYK